MSRRLGFRRWILTAALLAALLAGCRPGEKETRVLAVAPSYEGTVVAMGDSLTAGYGLPEEQAYPAVLENELATAGFRWRVINAGVSGETSSGALARIDWVMKLSPDIVILETGANDGLRGIDPKLVQENIAGIIRAFGERRVTVVLAGMQMVRNMGPEYNKAFAAIYPDLARELGVSLIPFFLEGVAADPRLNQEDGIHPAAEGYRLVARAVYPFVVEAIRRRKG